MITATIEKTVYSFSDLLENEELKEKVLAKHWKINVLDSFWHECIIEDFKEISTIIGLDIKDVYFSGFWSQGDGACFTGSYKYRKNSVNDLKAYAPQNAELHQIAKQLQVLQKRCFYNSTAEISHCGNYYHKNSMCFVFDSFDYGYENHVYKLEDEFEECFKVLAMWLYKNLEKQYDYLTSEVSILDTLKASEYEFTENGGIY